MTFDDIVDLAEKAGCDVSAMDGREYQAMWCDSSQLERFAASLIQAGAASRDAEVVSLTNQRDYEYVRAENAEQERDQFEQVRDQLLAQVAMLRNALSEASKACVEDWPLLRETLAATEPK